MKIISIGLFLFSLLFLTSCAKEEGGLQQGLYYGMQNINRTNDPGLGDTLPPEGNTMSYEEYQRERTPKSNQ